MVGYIIVRERKREREREREKERERERKKELLRRNELVKVRGE